MKQVRFPALVALAAFAGGAFAAGPDVIVGELSGISAYTAQSVNGVTYRAFSVGTTSCNSGTTPLQWIANTERHPVIGQSIYRWKPVNGAGQFEQIGAGHLKHGFTALQGTVCFSDCQPNPNGSALGVHCSDPYGSGLNGQQSGLGPRDEVNAFTGYFRYPFTSRSFSGSIARRIQVDVNDLIQAQNVGAIYFCEGQYVAPDDAEAGNGFNNASYRRISLAGTSPNFTFSNTSGFTTQRELSAINGWATAEAGVTLQTVMVPGEGKFEVGFKVTPIAGGMYHYEYAIHNQNSDRSASAFRVNFTPGMSSDCIDTASVGFRDIAYHSGEPYNSIDWSSQKGDSSFDWTCTETFQQNPNANALRWGTTYTFRFDSSRPPVAGTGTLALFKPAAPGSPTEVSFTIQVPSGCPCQTLDYDGNGTADQDDVNALIDDIASGATRNDLDKDYNGDGVADQDDVAYLIGRIAGEPC